MTDSNGDFESLDEVVDEAYKMITSPAGLAEQDQRKAESDSIVPRICYLALDAMLLHAHEPTRENVAASVKLAQFIGSLDEEQKNLAIFGLVTMFLETDMNSQEMGLEEYRAFVRQHDKEAVAEMVEDMVKGFENE